MAERSAFALCGNLRCFPAERITSAFGIPCVQTSYWIECEFYACRVDMLRTPKCMVECLIV